MAHHCCGPQNTNAQTTARFRRALWFALVVNATMLAVEIGASLQSGSVSLLADAVDFFGDAANPQTSTRITGGAATGQSPLFVSGGGGVVYRQNDDSSIDFWADGQRVTVLPGANWVRMSSSWWVSSIFVPSTATMMSSCFSPAFSAGPPDTTASFPAPSPPLSQARRWLSKSVI